jgi:hypothetical protein
MHSMSKSDASRDMTDPPTHRRTILGILAGGGLFLACMFLLVGIAITVGLVRQNPAGPVNLRPWLMLAVLGGAPASALGGAASRRIARHYGGPLILALLVFSIGVLEAAELLRHRASGGVSAPLWLVLLAPVVSATGALFGGWLSAATSRTKAAQPPAAAASGRQVRG